MSRRDEPAKATGPSRYYRPELDALRFVAFLLVFLTHTTPDGAYARQVHFPDSIVALVDGVNKACSFGLILFFALSSFLISELLTRERAQTGTVMVREFYIRRILRIWPLYFAGVLAGTLFSLFVGEYTSELPAMVWFAGFLGSWWIVLHGVELINPIYPLWSISVEEQFYLVIPWAARLANRRRMISLCVIIIVLANVRLWYIAATWRSDTLVWFDPLFHFQAFAGGMLLSLLLGGRVPNLAHRWRMSLLLIGAAFWLTATLICHVRFRGIPFPGSGHLIVGYQLVLLGTLTILLSALGLSPSVVPGWAIYLGRISFGLYVVHVFALDLLKRTAIAHRLTAGVHSRALEAILSGGINFVLAFLISVGVATASYRFFESRFLRMKKRFTVINSQPVAGDVTA